VMDDMVSTPESLDMGWAIIRFDSNDRGEPHNPHYVSTVALDFIKNPIIRRRAAIIEKPVTRYVYTCRFMLLRGLGRTPDFFSAAY